MRSPDHATPALVIVDRGSGVYFRAEAAWIADGMVHALGWRVDDHENGNPVGDFTGRSWPTRRCEVRWAITR